MIKLIATLLGAISFAAALTASGAAQNRPPSAAAEGAQQPKITAAEGALVNCTISSVRLEDQLKAAKDRIAELERLAGERGANTPPPPDK